MRKTIRVLAVILAAQALLIAGFYLAGPTSSIQAGGGPLLAVDIGTVDHIVLDGPDTEQVVLSRVDDAWRLPEEGDFPASSGRVSRLLEALAELEADDTVSTSSNAWSRFRVSDEDFERRITLATGEETLATVYVGSSPGLRRVHARVGAEQAVHVVRFGVYEVPLAVDEWRDKALLQIPADELTALRIGDFRLERTTGDDGETGWHSPDLNEGEALRSDGVDRLARQLASLRISRVLGPERPTGYQWDEPALVLTTVRQDGSEVVFELARKPDDDSYAIKTSNREEYFALPSFRAGNLLEAAARDALVAAGTDDEQEPEPEQT